MSCEHKCSEYFKVGSTIPLERFYYAFTMLQPCFNYASTIP